MDRRDHHRVQLRLPARLRWTTPFGQKTEVCTTVDVSRGGVLVPCREPHAEGMPLWVTFPYDNSLIVGQPEVFARVVRAVVLVCEDVAKKKNGNSNGHSNSRHKHENGSNGHNGSGNGNGHKYGNGNGNGNGHANGHHHGDDAAMFRSPSATEAAAAESAVEAKAAVHDADVAVATAFTSIHSPPKQVRRMSYTEFLDASPMSGFLWFILLGCVGAQILDGFDFQATSFALPLVAKEFNITPTQAGAIGSVTNIGLLLGALVFGPISDRFGRKPLFQWALATYAFGTFLSAAGWKALAPATQSAWEAESFLICD